MRALLAVCDMTAIAFAPGFSSKPESGYILQFWQPAKER
jgi:hypothetical protein